MRNFFTQTQPPAGGVGLVDLHSVAGLKIAQAHLDTWPDAVLLQNPSSIETRTVRLAATLAERRVHVQAATIERMEDFAPQLRAGRVLPVGTVEFVRAAMAATGISDPQFNCYPSRLAQYLNRRPRRTTLARALASSRRLFLKPVHTKLFDGFVRDPDGFDLRAAIARWEERGWIDPERAAQQEAAEYAERIELLHKLPPDTLVWCAEPVEFVSEWRYYLQGGHVIGFARYDEGTDSAAAPAWTDLSSMLADVPSAAVCSLDVGVARDGGTWLVEVNDGWALGYYSSKSAPSPRAYLGMLWARWQQLLSSRA